MSGNRLLAALCEAWEEAKVHLRLSSTYPASGDGEIPHNISSPPLVPERVGPTWDLSFVDLSKGPDTDPTPLGLALFKEKRGRGSMHINSRQFHVLRLYSDIMWNRLI